MLRQTLCIMIPSVHTDEPSQLHMALEQTCRENLLNAFKAGHPHTHINKHTEKCTFSTRISTETLIAMY